MPIQQSQGDHSQLHKVLNTNGYPRRFVSSATAPTRKLGQGVMNRVPRTTVTIPYIAGVSEEIRVRRVCLDCVVRVAFKTGRTCAPSSPGKPLPLERQAMVVYRIPCLCRKVYVGKTFWRLELRLKKHKDVCSWVI